jgi:hypothetical protein
MGKLDYRTDTDCEVSFKDFLDDVLEENRGHWAGKPLGDETVLIYGPKAKGVFSTSRDPCYRGAQLMIIERLRAIGLLVGMLALVAWVAGG